jgi:hypothetical protein
VLQASFEFVREKKRDEERKKVPDVDNDQARIEGQGVQDAKSGNVEQDKKNQERGDDPWEHPDLKICSS